MSDTPNDDGSTERNREQDCAVEHRAGSARFDRRDVLRSIGAAGAVSLASLAGCVDGSDGDGDGESGQGDGASGEDGNGGGQSDGNGDQAALPSYHRYVPAESPGSAGVSFVALDGERLRALEGRDVQAELPPAARASPDGEGSQSDGDPLLAYSGAGLGIALLGVSFGLLPYGFANDVLAAIGPQVGDQAARQGGGGESGQAGEDSDSPHRVDAAVSVAPGLVFAGNFDVDAIADAAENFEESGERDGFTVYEGIESDGGMSTETAAFAVDGSTLVVNTDTDADDPRASVDAVLDAAVGDADRLSDGDDAAWALRTAGHGLVTIGGWGVEPMDAGGGQGAGGDGAGGGGAGDDSVLADSDGMICSLAIDGEQVQSDLAAVYPDGEAPDRGQLEDELGTTATDRQIDVDGARVSATGTWPTVEPTPSAGTADGGGATPTSTPTPEVAYETEVDEDITELTRYTYELTAGSKIRITVEHTEGNQALVYVRDDDGEVHLNDGTSETDTWELEIEEDDEVTVEISPNDAASVTIEVAAA